ncbi:hypothetical protein COCOBI_13-3670 [Coccomyxa sp. Obi]|nr:hypothetical protein COCOBI_13-3670 [Coccomyxa sp. Obi]
MAAPKARLRFCGQARRAATFFVLAALAAHLCRPCTAADSGSGLLRRLLQTGTGGVAASQAMGAGGSAAGNNDFVGAAQQTLSSPTTQQAGSVAAKQLVSSATGNLPINSNDLNTLIQGVRATQTFSQYLATLGGAANKQTSLQSTLQGQNIAGLYKQQSKDDQFKVGSPSGSVYWTAGNQPVPAPAQAVAANFANALAPSVNQLTQSLMELIPSPPPPPPPPTVIQALAPLEQAATQRIADILTTSGQAAAASGSGTSGSGSGGSTASFQQQQPATVAVPVSFTHDTWNSDSYGRKLQQQQWAPTQQQQQQAAPATQQNWAPATNNANQQQWAPSNQVQTQQASNSANTWSPANNAQQWAPSNQAQTQQGAAANTWSPSNSAQQWAPTTQQGTGSPQQWDSSASTANNWSPSNNAQQWAPTNQQSTGAQQSWSPQQRWSPQQQWAPQAAAPTLARSADMTVDGTPIAPKVQLADGTWVPAQQQQQPSPANNAPTATTTNTNGADATLSQATGTGQPSPYTVQGASTNVNGQVQTLAAAAPAPAPASPSAITFPPVTINGVNLPGWSLPTLSPAPPLGPMPALAPLPLAPQPMPLPGQAQPASTATASFQTLTNQGVPLTQALAQNSALPQLQVIGGAPALQQQPNNNIAATQPAAGQPSGLPGFPPAAQNAVPNNNLVWVGLGGNGKQH